MDILLTDNKPTLKAIYICNSHQPTRKAKIAKEYVLPTHTSELKTNIGNQAEREKHYAQQSTVVKNK